MAHLKSYKTVIGGVVVITSLLMGFQNCSEVRLLPKQGKSLAASLAVRTTTQLKPPVVKPPKMRVLFFVDQSYSMIWQKCDADLDGKSPSSDPIRFNLLTGCKPDPGADQNAYRYAVMQKWLDELKAIALNRNPEDVKVAIIPFSGGHYARPNNQDKQYLKDRFAFVDLPKAQAWLTKLMEEHQNDLQKTMRGQHYGPDYLGTTVPLPTLTIATSLIQQEMQKLKDADELEGVPFRFVYLSDGVFKPIEPYLAKVKQIVGCPTSCSAEPSHPACQPYNYCYPYCPSTYCDVIIPRDFKQAFGDPAVNKVDLIVDELKRILDLPNQIKGGKLTMHLVKLSPEKVPDDDRPSPPINIFDEVFKASEKIHSSIINSPEPPFSIVNVGNGGYSYRLDQFYAMNLNAFVNDTGHLVADSDADGLSDLEEDRLGRNPRHPRTFNGCLDVIDQNHGCRVMGCDATIDFDGDGLSQCEEKSLDTMVGEADSDGDLVVELHEMLRGYNPNADQNMTNVANDGISDMDHFLMGLKPYAKINQLPEGTPLIKIVTEFLGFKPATRRPDERDVTGLYNIQIQGIPLVSTLETDSFDLFVRSETDPTPPADRKGVGGTPHDEDTNQILILARAVADQDPNRFYWMIYRKNVPALDDPGYEMVLQVDFAEFEYLDLVSRNRR
ncbi:MAG: hypothetical protein IT288_16370 [Bdellovibrionales bacterium]|nr:hypothetical protein [Bdellovibrionales bacterium]